MKMGENRIYAAIDLKSFYASVECVSLGLDPLKTNLVVADNSRTDKTICLAVSPGLKSFGVPGRPRLFQVISKVKEINEQRFQKNGFHPFAGKSSNTDKLASDPSLALDYIVARPRMSHYMQISGEIVKTYLQYISIDDIHIYSIDEVFIDMTDYLRTYGKTARELTMTLIRDVLSKTGITATAGIGTNMYLAKVAMDIVAKHSEPDADGVRIAELDEKSYRQKLWNHRPITDFWRVGKGYAKRLAEKGIYTMGDIAKCSLGKAPEFYSEDLLYQLFGVNAELLIDHAWGWEPTKISDIKRYKSDSNSISSGQVLQNPYVFEDAKLIVREMTDSLVLDMVKRDLLTDQITLTIVYDAENLSDPVRAARYHGPVTTDFYGRIVPKSAHKTVHLPEYTSSGKDIISTMMDLYDRSVNKDLLVRHIYVVFNNVLPPDRIPAAAITQPDLFTDYAQLEAASKVKKESRERENQLQRSIIEIQNKFGKNSILKGMNLQANATQRDRNEQVGGHRA